MLFVFPFFILINKFYINKTKGVDTTPLIILIKWAQFDSLLLDLNFYLVLGIAPRSVHKVGKCSTIVYILHSYLLLFSVSNTYLWWEILHLTESRNSL